MKKRIKDPFEKDIKWIEDRIDDLVNRPLYGKVSRIIIEPSLWMPQVDVFETETHLVVRAELAGVDQKSIKAVFESGYLIISGSRRENTGGSEEQRVRQHQIEIDYGQFRRDIQVPAGIEEDSISASYKDGMLEVKMKKLAYNRVIPIENK